MKIAIVILNYNGRELLNSYLPSVVEHSNEANIYVADNASTDDSLRFLITNFPEVNIIENSENYGYAKGYNKALEHIEEDIICLLNNDVKVTRNWLTPVEKEFMSNAKVAIIQPKILDLNNPNKFEYAGASGGFLDKYGFPYCRGRIFDTVEDDLGQYNDPMDILWASGACLFVRNSVFKRLKGLDNKFFAHMEEIDFCWRAFNYGHEIKCIPDSEVYHLGGGTLSYGNPKKTFLNFRNGLYMLVKNTPSNVFSTVFTRLVLDGIAFIRFCLQFKFLHGWAILKAHLNFYYNLSYYLEQRYRIDSERKYYKTKSVVWSYFIKGCKRFSCL